MSIRNAYGQQLAECYTALKKDLEPKQSVLHKDQTKIAMVPSPKSPLGYLLVLPFILCTRPVWTLVLRETHQDSRLSGSNLPWYGPL